MSDADFASRRDDREALNRDSETRGEIRDARVTRGLGGDRRLECPECGQGLPFDQWTECDRCGAHLSLKVKVEAPGLEER